METKQVTAQDFLDAIYQAGPGNVSELRFHHEKAWEEDLKPLWDALLSRVRQEAKEKTIEECILKLKEVLESESRYQVDDFDIDSETVNALKELKSLPTE